MKTELTKRERWALNYIIQNKNKGWISPTEIGREYGRSIGKIGLHSSTGSPIMKSLVRKGYAEMNDRGHYRALLTKKDEQPQANDGGWISVKDRKPKDYARVLYYTGADEHPEIGIGYFVYSQTLNSNVTHWMPLPEIPKEISKHDKQ